MRDMNYDYNNGYNNNKNNGGNTGLIVAVSVLACVLVAVIVMAILFFTGVISVGNSNTDAASTPVETVNPNDTELKNQSTPVVKQPVPVEKYMYIGNCNVSVTMRTGPGTDFNEICQVPVGAEVYVIEYTTDDFAKITYGGRSGYVMRNYVVTTRPQVWEYNESDVEDFVASSLKAFVNGINTGDSSYVYTYYAGDEAEQELKSRESIDAAVLGEEILSLNCHSVERISPSRVTCIRDSVIRVAYNDGSIKDVTETYKYTIDLSSGSMKIVDLAAM